jgi:pimeloyl-ACP methyl ester carboxylesterase
VNTFIYGGHRVSYREEGRGVPMIFLHNGGNDHRIWDYQVACFGTRYRVIAPDHPGYGMSDKPRIGYSLDFYTDYLGAFIKHLGAKRPVLVGNCIGSAMALRYALDNPGRVGALVLFNLATENTLRSGIFGPLYKITIGSSRARRVIALFAKAGCVSRLTRMMGFRVLYGKTGDPDPSFRRHLDLLYSGRDQLPVLYSLLSNFGNFRGLDSAVKPDGFPPCCVIWGKQNLILPEKGGARFCASFGPGDYRVMEDCGHMVMREKHEEVNRIISEFLERNGAIHLPG